MSEVTHIEPHWIDAPERETRCDNCGCPLVCGDNGWLDIVTFAVGCTAGCVRDYNERVQSHNNDLRCAGKGE